MNWTKSWCMKLATKKLPPIIAAKSCRQKACAKILPHCVFNQPQGGKRWRERAKIGCSHCWQRVWSCAHRHQWLTSWGVTSRASEGIYWCVYYAHITTQQIILPLFYTDQEIANSLQKKPCSLVWQSVWCATVAGASQVEITLLAAGNRHLATNKCNLD